MAKASARLGGAATLSKCLGRRLRSSLRPAAAGRGAALELVEHCLVVALAFGYRHGYAEIVHTLRPAAALLERAGFSVLNQPVGRTGHYLCDRGYLRDL